MNLEISTLVEVVGVVFAIYGSFVVSKFKVSALEDRIEKMSAQIDIANDFMTSNVRRLEHYDKVEDTLFKKLDKYGTDITTLKESVNQSVTMKDVSGQFAHLAEYSAQKECMNADIQKLWRSLHRVEEKVFSK